MVFQAGGKSDFADFASKLKTLWQTIHKDGPHAASSHPGWQASPRSREGERRWGPRHPQRVTFWAPAYAHCWQKKKKSNQICSSWAESKSNVPVFAVSILTQPLASAELRVRENMSSSLALVCMWQGSIRKLLFFFFLTSSSTTDFCNQHQWDSPFGKLEFSLQPQIHFQ